MTAPRVFISYSHDSPEHKAWVLQLATDLRAAGIDASIDQWDLAPGQDVASFMHDGISHADRVLLICTEPYVRKAESGQGGVGYERLIVTAEVIDSIETKKFVPIVRANEGENKVPRHLGPRLYIDFTNDHDYRQALEQLRRELLGAPATPKPPLGENPFSALIPLTVEPTRHVGITGALDTGVPVLSSPWFEAEREVAERGMDRLKISGGMELRFAIHEPINKSQAELLSAVRASKIDTFGWPIGVVLENRPEYRPRPFGDGVRAEVGIENDAITGRHSYDYWALSKNGDFFLLQNLFEDMREDKSIFFNTRIVRVTEALMFAGGLYTKLGAPPEARLSVRVSHMGLKGRTLTSAGGRRHVTPATCVEDRCEVERVVTLGTIRDTLVEDVQQLLQPLFMLFEFAEFGDPVYADIIRRFENGECS